MEYRLVVTGGLLLLIPGFITDIFGLILILPPTRAPVRGLVTAYAQSNLVVKVGTTLWVPLYGGYGAFAIGPRFGLGLCAASPLTR